MFNDKNYPTRLHADTRHPDFDPWWSRNATIRVDGELQGLVIFVDTEAGVVERYVGHDAYTEDGESWLTERLEGVDILITIHDKALEELAGRPAPLPYYPNRSE